MPSAKKALPYFVHPYSVHPGVAQFRSGSRSCRVKPGVRWKSGSPLRKSPAPQPRSERREWAEEKNISSEKNGFRHLRSPGALKARTQRKIRRRLNLKTAAEWVEAQYSGRGQGCVRCMKSC